MLLDNSLIVSHLYTHVQDELDAQKTPGVFKVVTCIIKNKPKPNIKPYAAAVAAVY